MHRSAMKQEHALGSKSEPPLPPPMGSVVKEFFKICSKPKNLMMESVTVGWNRRPPAHQHFTFQLGISLVSPGR